MPKAKDPAWIDWRNSAAREMLLEDLEPGGLFHLRDNVTAEEVFEFYKTFYAEFEKVVWSQFQVRYKAHIEATSEQVTRAREEARILARDRELHPRQTHNARGEPVFDMDEAAKMHLRSDVKNGIHKTMKPMQLRQSRPEYQRYKLIHFRRRIYQEMRRQKYIHYLDLKRTAKRRKEREERERKAQAEAEAEE